MVVKKLKKYLLKNNNKNHFKTQSWGQNSLFLQVCLFTTSRTKTTNYLGKFFKKHFQVYIKQVPLHLPSTQGIKFEQPALGCKIELTECI